MVVENNNKKTTSGLMARAEAINKALEDEKKVQKDDENQEAKPKKQKRRQRRERGEKQYTGLNKILNKIIVILILLCSMIAGGVFYLSSMRSSEVPFFIRMFSSKKAEPVVSKTVLIQNQLVYCQELVSLKQKYSQVIPIHNVAKKPIQKSSDEERIDTIIVYEGIIRVGIKDISLCDFEVSDDDESVKITLPDVEILGNDITSQTAYDVSKGFFVKLDTKKIFDKIEEDKAAILEKEINNGLLEEAKEHACRTVRQFLLAAGYENVEVK